MYFDSWFQWRESSVEGEGEGLKVGASEKIRVKKGEKPSSKEGAIVLSEDGGLLPAWGERTSPKKRRQ